MSVVTELKLYNKHQLVGYDHYDSLGCDWGCVFKWEVGIVIGVVFSNGNWNTQAKQVHPDKNPSDPLAVERSQTYNEEWQRLRRWAATQLHTASYGLASLFFFSLSFHI
ncbi:hypothetical protein VitviT2T_028054 [Vitis vinifera]|uniref:J domain-containing protein n=1 Tax=Vitis vinifera TaxID=29760 RepID=A0ABY9DTU1_VITVI|nr:hypothetical protein VitviT2T_028054 [Vitis vinifera]